MSKEEKATRRICPECRRLLDATSKTCPHCGKNLIEACPLCGRLRDIASEVCPYCGGNTAQQLPSVGHDLVESPSPSQLWYLAPLFSGIVGGLIGYVETKGRDKEMASKLLVFGVIWSIMLGLIVWAMLNPSLHLQ